MSQASDESIHYLRPAFVPGTDLIIANNCSKKWCVFHETYTLCGCAREAAASWRYSGKEYHLVDSGSMLMEPGETHCTTAVYRPGNYNVLLIPPTVVIDAARELGISTTPHLRNAKSNDLGLLSVLYHFSDAVKSGASFLEQQSWFTACLRMFLENTEQRPPSPQCLSEHHAIERIKHYLQERFTEDVSLDDLVKLTGISRFHMVRIFTKKVGMPPHIYQINIRIAKSRLLLKAGVRPMRVSTDLGFSDQSHFIKHFKRVWGITPSHYAKAVRL